MRNLVSNALKFTPSGGSVTISVDWDSDCGNVSDSRHLSPPFPLGTAAEGYFVVSVADSGVGISKVLVMTS